MSNLNEFAINLPMAGVGSVGSSAVSYTPPAMEPCADMTAKMTMPADIDPMSCDHIGVYVDSANVVNYDPSNPMVCVDMVMTVTITPPGSGATSSYKMVKRISMDKVKLACQAECETPISVVEEETPEQVDKMMAEFYAAQRARELSGLAESAGTKTAKVLISYDDKETDWEGKPQPPARASATLLIKAVKDKAHARHVFDVKHKDKYKNAKITRVTMED